MKVEIESGKTTMIEKWIEKIFEGVTTLQEILRVTRD